MGEKPRTIRRVEGLPPVELAAQALVRYHFALEENNYDTDSEQAIYYESEKDSMRKLLRTPQQIEQAIAQADELIINRLKTEKK